MTGSPQRFHRGQVVWWLGGLGAVTAVGAYFNMLTGFTFYDDEGTFMLSVKQYLGGMRLYQDVYSFYGPVYYLYNALVRTLTFTPVSHDVTRISSLLPATSVSLLAAWIALRLTKSLFVAAASLTGVSLMMWFFRAEAGHPQELTLLCLFALVAFPLIVERSQWSARGMFALGALVAALVLIKVNIGIFAAAALALVLVSQSPASRIGRTLGYAIGGGCLLMPAALMRSHLSESWARDYCVLMTASIGALVLCLSGMRRRRAFTWEAWLWAAGGFASTAAMVFAAMAVQGVSIMEVVDAVVFLPSRVFLRNQSWYVAPHTSAAWDIWAVIGAGLALQTVWTKPAPGSPAWQRLLGAKTAIVVMAAAAIVVKLMLDQSIFNMDIVPIVIPFAWLVLLHPDEGEQEEQAFPRALLYAVTTMQTLYGYPVMGSQHEFIQCLILVLLLVSMHDSFIWLTRFGTRPAWFAKWSRDLAVSGLEAILLLNLYVVWVRYDAYAKLPALELHGAQLVHVQPEQKAQFVPLVNAIRRWCDAFESLPGLASLNFWTEEFPLTGTNFDAWTLVVSPEQQYAVSAALAKHGRACIVYNPSIADFWNPGGEDIERLPLVQSIRREFKPVMAFGEYQLLVRKERPWDTADAGRGAAQTLR